MTPKERASHILAAILTGDICDVSVERSHAILAEAVRAAVAEEREACARAVETTTYRHWGDEATTAAAAVRARP